MIQIQNIPLPIGSGEEQLRKRAARFLGLNPGQLRSLTLARQSIDARKKIRRALCLHRPCGGGQRGPDHGPLPGQKT